MGSSRVSLPKPGQIAPNPTDPGRSKLGQNPCLSLQNGPFRLPATWPPKRYSEEAMTVRVLYRQDQDTWVASSPDMPRWTVVADTYAEAHQLSEEGVRFALERDDLTVQH